MNLLYYPNEFLAKEVKDVDIKDPKIDLKEIKEKMTDIMLSNGGIGLSANQIGLDAKIFIMGDTKENISLIINPKVLHSKKILNYVHSFIFIPRVHSRRCLRQLMI